jgi:glycosyltransferase involved in cell wall biosynthesis
MDIGDRLMLSLITAQLRFLRWQVNPDIVHVHWVDQRAFHCVKACLKPLVLTAWGSDINAQFLPDADPKVRRRIGQALAGADLVLVDSVDMPAKCAALAGRKIPTAILPLGIDTNKFRPDRREAAQKWRHRLEVPEGALVFLSVRAWGSLYGHLSILEAFAQALPRLGRDAVLIFKRYNGESNPESASYEAQLCRCADKLGVSPQLRWLDPVSYDEVPELYALADVILNYPSADGFPVTFMEAAACERPVISCRLASYSGTFAERYFCMVPPGEVGELADAMVTTAKESPGDRAELLAEARRVVVLEYDEAVLVKRLLGFYQELRRGRVPAN